jgi:hypothetical protein
VKDKRPKKQDVGFQYTSREWGKQVKIVIQILFSHPDLSQIELSGPARAACAQKRTWQLARSFRLVVIQL